MKPAKNDKNENESEVVGLAPAIRRQLIFWLVTLAIMVLFLWMFRTILLPFVAGMALAYFLDPVADKLEKWGASRLIATSIIMFLFVMKLSCP